MKFLKWILLVFFLFFLLWVIFFVLKKDFRPKIVFLDVGQGNGVLIQDKGVNVLIDSGNEPAAVRSLTRELGFFDRNLDVIIASHYDMDHVGLIPYYLNNYRVSLFMDSGVVVTEGESQRPLFDQIRDELLKNKVKRKILRAGEVLSFNDNFKIKVLFPGRFLDVNKLKSNSGSLVLQVYFYGRKILLTGDLPAKFEKVLVKRFGRELKSDILLAGHHGSKSSSSEEFLKAVSPEYLIISVGGDNDYGHPHKEVLERAARLKFKILRTDCLGNIKFYVNN